MQFDRNADMPARIDTAQSACYQLGSALAVGYAGEYYREVDGEKYPIASLRPFLDGAGIPRLGLRLSFELDANYLAIAKFDWEKLKAMPNLSFPPNLRN